MSSYFARTRPRRKAAVRWKQSAALSRLIGVPVLAKKKIKTEEHDAQVDLFRDHIWPRLVAGAVIFAVGNGGKRHPKVAKAMKEEGVTAGVPDIFAIHFGQTYFLEMKKPKGGRVSKEQKVMMVRLVGAGAICAVAAGLDEAIKQLEAWGLLEVAVATVAAAEEMAA
jgi:hypothetical protein